MVSVMNRKAVITEKRITDVFQRIGFHFSQSELHDLIRLFKSLQVCGFKLASTLCATNIRLRLVRSTG
jgi:hypothetical protein